jgi:hypothetical protein
MNENMNMLRCFLQGIQKNDMVYELTTYNRSYKNVVIVNMNMSYVLFAYRALGNKVKLKMLSANEIICYSKKK